MTGRRLRRGGVPNGLHAKDFASRYAEPLDHVVSERMLELGIRLKNRRDDHEHGIQHAAFMPHEGGGGGNTPDGRLNLDSGILNPELFKHLGPEASDTYANARLRDRIDAGIAHEFEEAKSGGDHRRRGARAGDGAADQPCGAGIGEEALGGGAGAGAVNSSRRFQPSSVNRNTASAPPAQVEIGIMIPARASSR
ncbi:MAG: hypothetical protein WKF75_05475 [Singulisphaera sp.]